MSIYLAIAGMPVKMLMIVGLGGVVGVLSGLFGVGGGFLLTPLLIMFGIPPAVAAASDSNQIVAASCSGALAHRRLGNVDIKMGATFLVGGVLGGTIGAQLVKFLRVLGNYDFAVTCLYVVMLAGIGGFMFFESMNSLRNKKSGANETAGCGENGNTTGFKRFLQKLPLQTEFKVSGIKASIIFVVGLGFIVGLLAALMGVGGGFITVPAMIYLLGMPTMAAIGTDLFQIVFTSMNVTFQQAITNHTVDIVLAVLIFCGSTVGAQVGARLSKKFNAEQIRVLLSVIVLVVMVKMLFTLVSTPEQMIILTHSGGGH